MIYCRRFEEKMGVVKIIMKWYLIVFLIVNKIVWMSIFYGICLMWDVSLIENEFE